VCVILVMLAVTTSLEDVAKDDRCVEGYRT